MKEVVVLVCCLLMCFFYGFFPFHIRVALPLLYFIFVAFGWKELRSVELLYSEKNLARQGDK